MPKKSTITEEKFSPLKQLLITEHRFSKENIEAAYQYYVKGKSLSELAKERSVTIQALHIPIKRIWAIYNESRNLPDDWITVEVTLPPDMAKAVLQIEKTALASLKR